MDFINTAKKVHSNAIVKGFWDDTRTDGECIALMHSELSEALESLRNGEDAIWVDKDKPEGWLVELADTIIRILDFVAYKKEEFNLEYAIMEKMKYNETRQFKHGKKF